MTNFEYLRERLLAKKGLSDKPGRARRFKSHEELANKYWTEECNFFVEGMFNRLCMGGIRYEDKTRKKSKKNEGLFLKGARQYLKKYEETGNTEKLIDVANFILLEFKDGYHPKKHFKAEDDGEHYI